MNIVFCGFGRAGKECLIQLLNRADLSSRDILVFGHSDDIELIPFVEKLGIRVSTKPINQCADILSEFQPDYLVSAYYQNIVSDSILALVTYKAMNLHPSLLPDYKGCFSAVWAILNGEVETGVSFHYMTNQVDCGNILLQKKLSIKPDDTAYSLYHRLVSLFLVHFNSAFEKLIQGDPGAKQDTSRSSRYYARKIPFNGILVANETSYEKARKFVRAMHFPPKTGATFVVDGKEMVIDTLLALDKIKTRFKEN